MTLKHKKISSVITAVLGNDNEILILRRSLSTRSMQNKWAGISGYLEPGEDLLSRALVEIYEETKIYKNQVILNKILDPICVEIKTDKLLFIQPFYFLTSTRRVILNWEHIEYRWISWHHMYSYEFVPKFLEILKFCFNQS